MTTVRNLFMFSLKEISVITEANSILDKKARYTNSICIPSLAFSLCRTKLAYLESEAFAVAYLDCKNRLISFDVVFTGTVNSANVYSRDVVKLALKYNAVNVIFSHNHPSGEPTPSAADKAVTKRLTEALTLFNISVLDHIIVGVEGCTSFAERGLI
ncbi:DNA repair protein RadC (plasmid) [Moritella sp. 24]|nr:DNA repair protein RadC [Moritella sp. 24]QUM78824.1 DNA repair protein RadC [Moritella sp. 24]